MNVGEETAVIESIQPMFPDVDRETVRAVLESTGFHAESAVEALLGMVAIDGAGASGPQEQPPSGVADLLSLAAEPPSSEQQIADDEALARQLQQQARQRRRVIKHRLRQQLRQPHSQQPRQQPRQHHSQQPQQLHTAAAAAAPAAPLRPDPLAMLVQPAHPHGPGSDGRFVYVRVPCKHGFKL